MSAPEVKELSVDEALERLEAESALFIDVRDTGSYRRGHVPGASHIGDHNIEAFVRDTDKQRAVIVYCYHGNSSIGGAAYLQENGFAEVYSMRGGFTDWGTRPMESVPAPEAPPPRPVLEPRARPSSAAAKPAGSASRRRGLRDRAKAAVRRLLDS
jgi:thiosulfate sulfurtransferase